MHAWDVDKLVELSVNLPVIEVPLEDIAELDEPYWFQELPTCREIATHIYLSNAADLNYPIILSASGRVLDGMHRVVKALLSGSENIKAVKLQHDLNDLPPDFVGLEENELPY